MNNEGQILCTADLHLTDKRNDSYRHDFMRAFVDIAKRRKPKSILILGDLTEEKDRHSAVLVNRVVRHLSDLAEVAPVQILMGNHDYLNEGHPFFEFLSMIDGITWIGTVTQSEQLQAPLNRIFANCLFLPHTRNYERDWEPFMKPKHPVAAFDQFRYVFAHNTFQGAGVGFGRELGGIPLDVFPPEAQVVAGDVHMPQVLGPVTYVGSPYTVDYGDEYTPRIMALATRNMRSIGLGAYPQKRLVHIKAGDVISADTFNDGDLLKVRVDVDDLSRWSTLHQEIIAWAAKHNLIAQRIEPVLTKKAVRKHHKISDRSSDDEVVTTYGKRVGLASATVKTGLRLLGE